MNIQIRMVACRSLGALAALVALSGLVACDEPKVEPKPEEPKALTPAATPSAAPTPSAPVKKKIDCGSGPNVVFNSKVLEDDIRKKLQKPEGAITQKELAKVKSVNITRDRVDELDPCVFPHLTGMHDLFIGPGALDDLSALEKHTQLVSLRVSMSNVSNIGPLAKLTQLDRVDLAKTPVEDIRPLAQLKALTELTLDDTRVEDLSPLAACTALEQLSIKNTLVKDLAPLRDLTKLRRLDITGTTIVNTAPLAKLRKKGLKIQQ